MRKEKCQCGGRILRGQQKGGGYIIRCSRCGPNYKVMISFVRESVVKINFCSNCGAKVSPLSENGYRCSSCGQTCHNNGEVVIDGNFSGQRKNYWL